RGQRLEAHLGVAAARRERGRGLEDRQRAAGVAAREPRDGAERLVSGADRGRSEAALAIGQGAPQDGDEIVLLQGLEAERLASREQRRVDRERRVLRRRADQRDRARLDVGQERVLLGLVEPMDLVQKDDRTLALVREPLLRGGDDLAQLL